MKISTISPTLRNYSFPKKNNQKNESIKYQGQTASKANIPFRAIYIEDVTNIGSISQPVPVGRAARTFLPKDLEMLEQVARLYPHQDCFIKKGGFGNPCLEFREKPVGPQVFTTALAGHYVTDFEPKDDKNPCIPLLITPEDRYLPMLIGLPSYISTNPSLPFTVMAGFEVHKKLLQKKYEIQNLIGKGDEVSIGDMNFDEKAHESIKDVEIAVKRYLLESSLAALTDKASQKQIYESVYPRIQSTMERLRKYEMLTSIGNRDLNNDDEMKKLKVDICDVAMKTYPDMQENIVRIEQIIDYMMKNGYILT